MGIHNCGHSEDAGAVCDSKEMACVKYKLILMCVYIRINFSDILLEVVFILMYVIFSSFSHT